MSAESNSATSIRTMYMTLVLVMVHNALCKPTYSTTIQIPKLCSVLFHSHSACPPPSFIRENLVCFVNTTHPPRFRRPGFVKINKNNNQKIRKCAKWSRVTFTFLKGRKCVQGDAHTQGSKNTRYSQNMTLHQACEEGKLEVIKHILSQSMEGINSRSPNRHNRTPVMTAARKGQIEVFDFLVSNKGCDLSVVDDNRDNLFHVACLGGNINIVTKLVESGIFDIEIRGWSGWTPMMGAVFKNNWEVFKYLVGKGCNVLATDKNKNNILQIASLEGSMKVLNYIVSQKVVDIDSRGQYERTAVMLAAEQGHMNVVDLLVSRGCNLTYRDGQGNSLLHVACIGGHAYMVKNLISRHIVNIDERGNFNRTPVMLSAEKGHIDLFDILVNKSCNLAAIDASNNNILHIACMEGQVNMVKHILSKNILDIDSRGERNRTSVMLAAKHGHIHVVKLLVQKGCSLIMKDDIGRNILHIACIGGYADMVKYLMSSRDLQGMDKVKDKFNQTPLQVAETMGLSEIVNVFKELKNNHRG